MTTERSSRAEPERVSLARAERLAESDVLGIATGTGDRFDDANDAFLALIGYSREDLEAGRISWRATTPPEYALVDERALEELRTRGRCTAVEKAYVRKDGTRVPVLFGATALEPGARTWICFAFDLTSRKRAEAALRASEARFRLAQDLSLDAFTILRAVRDGAGRIVDFECAYANEAAARVLRRAVPALTGRRLLEVLPGHRATLFPAYVRVVETGEPHDLEVRYQAEGIDGWFRNMAVRADDGVAVSFRDITGQKLAEAALRESQGRLEAILQATPAVIYLMDAESRFVHVNRRFEELFGTRSEQLRGRSVYDLFPHEVAAAFDANNRRVLEAGRPLEFEEVAPHPDGPHLYASVKAPLRGAWGQPAGVVGVSTDITEKRRAETDRQKLVAVVENSSELIGIADPDGTVWFMNRAGQELVGLAGLEEVRRTRLADYLRPEDRPCFLEQILPAVMREGRWEGEVQLRHFRSGEPIPVLSTLFQIRDPERGAPLAIATVTRHIAEQKRAEAEREALLTREQAARAEAQRAAHARDMFLARASHELRTPLTSVLASVRLLEQALAGSARPMHEELVEMASRNLEAILALIDDLLDASKLTAGAAHLTVEPLALAEVVAAAREAIEAQAREKGVRLHAVVAEGLGLEADRLKLLQVLTNLLGNAVKFTPSGGEVCVEAAPAGAEVVLRVRDTGEGIPPQHLADIFEPFSQLSRTRRTKPRGTGLGLAICRQIVTLHGGRIWAESEGPGKGSSFVVVLPRERRREGAA